MKNTIYTLTLFSLIFFGCNDSSTDDLKVPSEKELPDNVNLIISNKCSSCHGNPPLFTGLATYTDYNEVKNDIDEIITRIESGNMPQGGPKLSDEDIELIKTWQNDGFPGKEE